MNLHEYQAKRLLHEQGLPVPSGVLVRLPADVDEALETLGGSSWVIKAQVHSGGRGKAGGVVLVDSEVSARSECTRLLGSSLRTKQSAGKELPINAVLIEQPTVISRELYLALLVDREAQRMCVITSSAGGMDIEEVAETTPEKILRQYIDPVVGLMPYQVRNLGFSLGLTSAQIRELETLLIGVEKLFRNKDASLIEINPLVVDNEGHLLILDAKINIDDSALFRQVELSRMRDITQEDAREAEASTHQLNYVSLEGNIGCMVNGAGLAMATMDLVKLKGARPANFLDVGGTATPERVAEAFRIILSDTRVTAVLVNIFGGIVRCDLIAQGIIQAIQQVQVTVPVIVRLEGTKASEGLQILAESNLRIETAVSFDEAAHKAVEAAKGARDVSK